MHEDTRGGESFQRWTGQDYYIWGDGRGIFLGEGGTGAGLLFSTAIFSQETLSGLFATQDTGDQFSQEQLEGLKTAATEGLNQLPEIQFAKATSSLAGGLLGGGASAGLSAISRNAFRTQPGNAIFYSGSGAANAAEQFALESGKQTITMT